MARLFTSSSRTCQEFKPIYPQQLYDIILEYANIRDGYLAVDIATGDGQAANQLADHFTKVIGIDSREDQISSAVPERANVSFRVADCHRLPLKNESVDLVTVAEGLHWLELGSFYKEVSRVLKPGCAFAAWSHGLYRFRDFPEANDLLNDFTYQFLKDYWDERDMKSLKGYQGMEPVEPTLFDFKKLQLIEESTTTLSNMQKQMAIWSSYVSYKTKNGEGDDPLTKLFGDLKEVTHSSNFDQEVVIDYPIALFLVKKDFLSIENWQEQLRF
eukprot:TRINITY_DN2451_c2_g2_i10.p1 TRINITY_DN2451_c2_g2~~TRINITY_DN2451_c2_g2_i10.p1  ORF type:complete len:283 (+),score=24.00 TRINITY_DN2451_c2_g2_i10:36-851(+)